MLHKKIKKPVFPWGGENVMKTPLENNMKTVLF